MTCSICTLRKFGGFDKVEHSTTADIEGNEDEIVVGAKHGYAIMNRKTKKLEYITKVWEKSDGEGKDKRYAVTATSSPKCLRPRL